SDTLSLRSFPTRRSSDLGLSDLFVGFVEVIRHGWIPLALKIIARVSRIFLYQASAWFGFVQAIKKLARKASFSGKGSGRSGAFSGNALNAFAGAQQQQVCRAVGEQAIRSEEHTSELQSRENLVCRLLLE